ncbi:30S ribosomal protein S3, partial [Acinetobacter baumannii]|nr:30S ribosomal protein S3 [Acinetobacter baumannii]
ITIIVSTGKAAVLIGRKGAEITALRARLENMTGKKVFVKALEIKNPNRDAQLVAESIATAIEKRVAYKRAVQQAIQRAEKAGVLGIKVMTSGRLNGAEIARSEWTLSGRVPLHTLSAEVDYATATGHTTDGSLGIKVWIFNGEVLPTKKEGGTK